jgi:putative transposase
MQCQSDKLQSKKCGRKALEAENAKLKKMLAEHMLDVATLKEMLGKNF